MSIDLATLGRELKRPVEQVESAVRLLDEGNTIPFITRFRKDETGGLNEEQLLLIKQSVVRLRSLAERKTFVLKSIESQGSMTDALALSINAADSARVLEGLYLPFKPKKQTLALVARQNGLEPLANDIFDGREPEKDLPTRATDFVRVDRNLNSVDEVIAGVGHILAEKFGNHIELRNRLREQLSARGKLMVKLVPMEPDKAATSVSPISPSAAKPRPEQTPTADPESTTLPTDSSQPTINGEVSAVECRSDAVGSEALPVEDGSNDADSVAQPATTTGGLAEVVPPAPVLVPKKRKKKKKKVEDPYGDFRDFSSLVSKIPYHKLLAINRGEKIGRLKVRIEFEEEEFLRQACQLLVPQDHPFAGFMQDCVRDAMTRMVIPSVEREVRRELTEAAEKHAVQVFAKNLKNLLLQAPVRNHRVLAIDPGYKRGCSIAVIDCGGRVLEHDHIFVVGNDQRRMESMGKVSQLIKKHAVNLIAIGNGAACREAEQLVSDMIVQRPECAGLKYGIVNEAGASVYSTSEVGREELPDLPPAVRSAVSIGRRLIDPLSELVKISPANIGVGLYQHDVKARHLADSLDDVVEFCVNRVGVDVNTASPSLLRYVSGLNQLTARRVFEFRQENGPFKNREQLRKVAGFGDATFVQAAGFLRIRDGDAHLDATSVHPESYEIASRIFAKANVSAEEVFPPVVHSGSSAAAPGLESCPAGASTAESDSQMVESSLDPSVSSDAVDLGNQTCLPDASLAAELPAPTTVGGHSITATDSSQREQRRAAQINAIRDLKLNDLAAQLNVGQLLLKDILNAICRPDFDPRQKFNQPVFRSGIIKIDDLKKDMCLDAQVVNVVDFGAFVDIGIGTSCLVHVSQLANHFIRDPHRFFAVGDVLKVWVKEVDLTRRRVVLTAILPTTGPRPQRAEKPATAQQRNVRKPPPKKFGFKRPEVQSRNSRPPRKPPIPAKPISDGMLKGSEPMRSFSDLAQFFDKKPDRKSNKEEN